MKSLCKTFATQVALLLCLIGMPGLYASESKALREKQVLLSLKNAVSAESYDEAVRIFEKNKNKYRNSLMFRYYAGIAYLRKKSPDRETGLRNCRRSAQLLESILPFFRKASENPFYRKKLPPLLLHDALAHYYLGNYKKAIGLLELAASYDDSIPEIWYNMGMLYETLHNLVEANRAYARYRKIITTKEEDF